MTIVARAERQIKGTPLPLGSVISDDCFDPEVKGWHVSWPGGDGRDTFIPNLGGDWWHLAVVRLHQGARVIEERQMGRVPEHWRGELSGRRSDTSCEVN